MHWVRRLFWRLEVLFLKVRPEEELDEELRYHLERETRENVGKGFSPKEARRRALLEFGGLERTKEQVRDVRGGRRLDDFFQDVRYASRTFTKRPGFAGTAVVLMALGIGATATIFSVVNGVLLIPLPYPNSDQLLYVDEGPHNAPDFLAWEENLKSVEGLAARAGAEGSLTGQDGPVRVRISLVTPGFLALLGGRPLLGRLFVRDDQTGGPAVVVLDHAFWVRAWGSDPSVIGRQIRLDGEPVVIAGILDPGFMPPEVVTEAQVDVWALLHPDESLNRTRESRTLRVLGLLKSGVSIAAAQAEMDALNASLADDFPEYFVLEDGSPRRFPLVPLKEATTREASSTLVLLLGAVGLLLLIACANVANLFLARGTARAGELSLRGALGASRGRITRQLLTESAVLACAGGLLGVVLAFLGVWVFTHIGPGEFPRLAEVTMDSRVLFFAFLISVTTGILCGVFPVLQAVGGDLGGDLREALGRSTQKKGKRRFRNSLVVSEVALTLVLLTGAGLLFRSLLERMQVDPGFQPAERVVMPLQLGDTYSPESRAQFVLDLRERLGSLAGVRNVAAGWVTPFIFSPETCCWASRIWPADDGEDPGTGENIFIHPVTEGYFETLGIDMALGRGFQASDIQDDPMVAILNPPLARRLFGSEDAVGRQVMAGGNGPLTVVGVEAGHHHWTLDLEIDEAIYLPYQAWGTWFGLLHVVLESGVPLQTLAPAIRQVVGELDPEMAPGELSTMDHFISRSLATPRFLSILFGAFAVVAFFLACGGVYASMLYSVGQRRREMGIRLAMGARQDQVSLMVLKEGAALALIGLGLGILVALGLSRLMTGLVWGITVTDLSTYGTVCSMLGATALAASWIPARRASRTDLVETLKAE